MNSEQLRYFQLAYSEGSFSAAARKVPMSLQGLTKSVRSLERELGVPLFAADEDGSGVQTPTPYAHELFEFAAVLDSNERLLHESFGRLREEERYTVRLGCSPGVLGAYGPEVLEGFEAEHPNVSVPVWETNDALCEEGLRKGSYDVALCIAPLTAGCEGVLLYESPMHFWMRRDLPLARRLAEEGRETLRVEDLAGVDVAIPDVGYKCSEHLRQAAVDRGVELGHLFGMPEIFRIYGFAMAGRGVGFANGTLVGLPVFNCDPDVTAYPMEGLTWGFVIERLATHALGDAERWLWERYELAARDLPGNMLA